MTQRQLENDERDRIAVIAIRLDLIKEALARGYKRSLPTRTIAWDMIKQQVSAQVASMAEGIPDVKPAILPEPEPKAGVQ